ncbi:MAG: CPBP family intramembrane glutamic endopeptidase [Polyangiaceae bacterium]
MRVTPTFVIALALWMGTFVLMNHFGTWAPLGALGPILAGIVLFREPAARQLLRPNLRLTMIGLGMGSAMVIATYVLFDLFSRVAPELHPLTIALYGALRAPGFTLIERGVLVSLVAVAEEIVFRGTVLPDREVGLRKAAIAVAMNSTIVGVAHVASGNWLLALVAGLTAVLWGGLRVWTKSSVPSILTHIMWDLSVLVIWPLK